MSLDVHMKQGDQYDIPILLQENNEPIDLSDVEQLIAKIKKNGEVIQELTVEISNDAEFHGVIIRMFDNNHMPVGKYDWDIKVHSSDGSIRSWPLNHYAVWQIT